MRKYAVVVCAVGVSVALATGAAAQPHRQIATVATPPGADLATYPVHRFRGTQAQVENQCRLWGRDHGLREAKLGRSWTGWNFHEEVEGGRFVFETLAADVLVLVDAAGNAIYKLDCCNRLQEAVAPAPPPPPPPPVKTEVIREPNGDVTVNVNVTQQNTQTVILPREEPKQKPEKEESRPERPRSNRQIGITGGFMPGRFSSRPFAGAIQSVSDWLVCIDGRTWNVGVVYGTPARHFQFVLGQTIIADQSFTRRRTNDGTEVLAEARGVKMTGPRAGYAVQIAEHWPVSPYLSGSIGAGRVTGRVHRTRRDGSHVLIDETDGGRLLNTDWFMFTELAAGVAGQKDDFVFALKVAGFENPGVFWRGSVQIVYWPGLRSRAEGRR